MCKSMNRKIVFVCLLMLGIGAIGLAAEQYQYQRPEQGTRQMTGQTQQGYMGQSALCTISKINDATVNSSTNEKLGSVKEVILDNSQNKIQYVILSANSKLYPVPWSAFNMTTSNLSMGTKSGMNASGQTLADANMTSMQDVSTQAQSTADQNTMISRIFGHEKVLTLNISKDQLQQAPTVDSIDISRLSSPSLKRQIDDFYSKTGMMHQTGMSSRSEYGQMAQSQNAQNMTTDQMTASQRSMNESNAVSPRARDMAAASKGMSQQANLCKASDLIGINIQNTANEKLGDIKDIVVDVQHGNLAYCLVSFGGVMGVGKDVAAVPWSAINIQPDLKTAKLDATTDKLKNATIEQNNLDKLSQPQFARQIHENFAATPYWEVMGYVPGTQGQVAGMSAWQAGSKFNQKFDPTAMTTVEGTIEDVSTFEPERGAAPGMQLKIKTTDDKSMTVYVGPQNYLTQQGINFSAGSTIKVTGSKIREGFKSVIMATEVVTAGKTITLRDAQGNPQWQQGTMENAPQQNR